MVSGAGFGRPRQPAPTASTGLGHGDTLALAALLALGVLLPLAVNAAAGALGIPHSDDFTFRRTAEGVYQTGQVRLGGWAVMTFVGQLVFVQPFLWIAGGQAWAFAAAAGALTAIGIAAAWGLARRLLPRAAAAVAVLSVLLFPGFLVLVPTFMTDVPAWAAELLCLALGAGALARTGPARARWLAASLAAGCFAFSIRDFGAAAPAAVLVAATLGETRRRTPYIAAWAGTIAAGLAIWLVTSHLPGRVAAPLHAPAAEDVTLARQAVATLALVCSPALVLAVTARWRGRLGRLGRPGRWVVTGTATGLAVAALVDGPELVLAVRGGLPVLLVGNEMAAAGATGSGAGAGIRPVLFVPPTWKLLNLAALVAVVAASGLAGWSTGAAAGAVAGRWRASRTHGRDALAWLRGHLGSTPGMLALFAGTTGVGALAFGVVSSLYDRYLFPVAFPVSILLLLPCTARGAGAATGADKSRTDPAALPPASSRLDRPVRLAGGALALALLGVLGLASGALLLNRAAFDVARWRMGEDAMALGLPATQVDAGYEWVGYHATTLVIPNRIISPDERWYYPMVPDYLGCAVVASSAIVEPYLDLVRVDVAAYRLLLVTGPAVPLYLYRSTAPGCP